MTIDIWNITDLRMPFHRVSNSFQLMHDGVENYFHKQRKRIYAEGISDRAL